MNEPRKGLLAEELDFYDENKERFLHEHTNRHLLIKGRELIASFPTMGQAVGEGVRQFGSEPFLVRLSGTDTPTFTVPVLPCRDRVSRGRVNSISGNDPQLFTYGLYRELLQMLKERGYRFALFSEDSTDPHRVYIRHDLDLDIDKAVVMAGIEADHAVRATYFVMFDNAFYNVGSSRVRRQLKTILDGGHDIGVHVVSDPTLKTSDMIRHCAVEARALGELLNRHVSCFSFHRPVRSLLDTEFTVPGLANAYAKRFFAADRYISDSNHDWRRGDPRVFLREFDGEVLQILTHPFWWTEEPTPPTEKFSALLEKSAARAHNYLVDNVKLARKLLSST